MAAEVDYNYSESLEFVSQLICQKYKELKYRVPTVWMRAYEKQFGFGI